MKTNSKYVIGDIQGCYKEFKNLLKLIDPNKEKMEQLNELELS